MGRLVMHDASARPLWLPVEVMYCAVSLLYTWLARSTIAVDALLYGEPVVTVIARSLHMSRNAPLNSP